MSPVVVRDDGLEFLIHTRELPFEPPHVHVWYGHGDVRIELISGTFMDAPPSGKSRAILAAFARHAAELRRAWEEIHGPFDRGAE